MIPWTLTVLPFNLTSTSEAGIYGSWKLWFILESTKFSELLSFTFLAYLYTTAAEVKKKGENFELNAKNYLLHMNFSPVLQSLPRFCQTLARGPSDPTHLIFFPSCPSLSTCSNPHFVNPCLNLFNFIS